MQMLVQGQRFPLICAWICLRVVSASHKSVSFLLGWNGVLVIAQVFASANVPSTRQTMNVVFHALAD